VFAEVVNAASHTITGITYDSVAMTKIDDNRSGTSSNYASLWYLLSPSEGSNSVVVTSSQSVNQIYSTSTSYVGAKQAGQPDSDNEYTATSGTSKTLSTMVVAGQSWLIMGLIHDDASAAAAGAGTKLRALVSRNEIFDSNSAKDTGSQSLSVTSISGNQMGIIASFAPAPSTFTSVIV